MSSPAQTWPPLFVNYRFGDVASNLEHRRVNVKAVNRELSGKHWFPSQPSTNGSHLSKELFAQFRAELVPQTLANSRMRRGHFLVR